MKFQMFQAGQGGQFNFQLVTENNDPVLVSADFANRDDCVSAIRTLIESLREEANYTKSDDGETFKFQISNGGQTLVESVSYESEEEVNEAIRTIQDDASANEEFNVEFITRRRVTKAPPRDIDIATLYDFTLTSQSSQPGFERIKDENNNLYYFIYNDENGSPIVFGRSFPTASRRDGRIRTVIKSGGKANKYEIITTDGSPYFIIKASNGQEIARSKPFGSVQEAQQVIDKMVVEVPTYAERFVKPSKPKKVNQYILTRPSTSGDVGFESFRNEDNKEYYFHLNDEDAKALLYSEGYSSSRGRNNGIKSVIRNGVIRDRYEIREDEAQYYFILRAGNRQEIARSRNFSSKNEAENAITWLVGRFPIYAAEYSVTLPQTETFTLDVERAAQEAVAPEAKSARDIDSYNLDRASTSGKTGFESFKNEDDGEHYFHYNDDGGNAMWYSEGYTAPRSRDNGIRSVIKNGVLKDRYEIKEEGGEYYVALRAGNRQEIARSRNFGSREEAEKSIIWFRSRLPGVAAEQGVELDKQDELTDDELAFAGLPLRSSKRDIDSYNLDRASTSGKTGFESFKNEDDGEYYFHYNDDGGNAMWYSEGYTAPRSRDNGIRSVIKNGVLAERYEIKEEGGKYYIVLKAGNRQEIARSRYFDNREDAEKGIIWMRSRLPGVAVEQGIELDKQDELTDEERSFAGIPLLATAAGAIGKDIDTYDFSRASTSGKPGFESFKSDKNGEYYFHLNDENGDALFYSEGYTSASGRDNGIRSVIKNGGLSERYQLVEEGGKYYWVLKAGNRQEIARSRTFNSKGEAEKYQGWYMAALPAYAASYGIDLGGAGGKVSPGDTAIYGFVDSDDYDISRWGSAGTPGYYSYQSEADGKYYFLLYGDDRNASFYSPGYDSAAERDAAMKRFAAFSDAQGSYKLREQDGKYYYALYGPNGDELGRSGFYENEDSAKGFLHGFLGALPLWAASAGLSTAEGDAKADAGVVAGDVSTDTAEVETEAASVGTATGATAAADTGGGTTRSYEEEEKSGGGFPAWLRWLLLLLLLLLLLWLLMRACGTGSGDVGINPGATENSTPSGVVVPTDTLEDAEEADAELDAVAADSVDVDSTTYREANIDLEPLGPGAAALGFSSRSMAGKIADFLSDPNGGDGGAMKFIMDNTRFGLNEAHLDPAGYPSVTALAKILKAYPDATLRIVGHIDGTESEAYDGKYQDGTGITLSEIRARCIYRRLIDKGIAAGRMTFEGKAASENIGDNNTASGRSENRRIELFISR